MGLTAGKGAWGREQSLRTAEASAEDAASLSVHQERSNPWTSLSLLPGSDGGPSG